MAGIPTPTDPLDAVRSQAEAAANQRGYSFLGPNDVGLRLFADGRPAASPSPDPGDPGELISPFALGRTYELLLAPSQRRRAGAHLTPATIAHQLVGLLPDLRQRDRALDPSVGGGAFLLAVADRLVDVGATPADVIGQLHGLDIDPGAVAVAEAALAVWSLDHGVDPRPLPNLVTGDGLRVELPVVEAVVGNPPFLNQLKSSSSNSPERRAALRNRWGDLIGAYTDDAWLFMAAGLDALTPAGALAMVQPVSIFAARHAGPIRDYAHRSASLRSLWVAGEFVFDAAVQVCGLVLDKRDPQLDGSGEPVPLKRFVGPGFDSVASLPAQPAPHEWGAAASETLGVPPVSFSIVVPEGEARATVGDLASVTAGFRDQFYGLVPYVSEGAVSEGAVSEGAVSEGAVSDGAVSQHAASDPAARLVTVGMIDVLGLSWGTRTFRFAKKKYEQPIIDVDALRAGDPQLGVWVDARRRPKLLMATQTRVVELWVDEEGAAVPTTPVLSIEPLAESGEPGEVLWLLAAALTAPVVTAHFLAAKFGTALSLNSMKLAASDMLAVPLPHNDAPWREAAQLLRSSSRTAAGQTPDRGVLQDYAALMGNAYGVDDPALMSWWLGRL